MNALSSLDNPDSQWLDLNAAMAFLHLGFLALRTLVAADQLAVWTTPDGSALRFRRSDLEGLLRRCSPDEAVAALSRSGLVPVPIHLQPTDPKGLTMSTSPAQGSIAHHIPAKQAAPLIGLSYKTLLRLIHEGVVPAIDLNAGTSHGRPRFTVDPVAAKEALVAQAQTQQQARRPVVTNLDLRRLLTVKPEGRSA